MTQQALEAAMGRLHGTVTYDNFQSVDMVSRFVLILLANFVVPHVQSLLNRCPERQVAVLWMLSPAFKPSTSRVAEHRSVPRQERLRLAAASRSPEISKTLNPKP